MAEFPTGNVRCAKCGSRLEVVDTASGGRTIAVIGLGASVEQTARAMERFFPPGAGPDLFCPACDASINLTAPYRSKQSPSVRHGIRRSDEDLLITGALLTSGRQEHKQERPPKPDRRVLQVCWRLRAPNGRVFECSVHQMPVGFEVRMGYGDDHLLYSELAVDREHAHTIAAHLKATVLQDRPAYVEVPVE